MKAMPCVRKCVFRSEALSKRRPHTLQLMLPSPSSSPFSSSPDLGVCDVWRLSCWSCLNLCVMKRWRLSEAAEAKQAPHCTHCSDADSLSRCFRMCCWNSPRSSVLKPHGAQRKPPSSSSASSSFSHERVRLAGLVVSSPPVSGTSAPPPTEEAPPS